ncbi:MAG: hypothetical protein ABI634_19270 [Acidobacteriota bacterium]
MVRIVAIGLVVAFATLASIDNVWCPDGCREKWPAPASDVCHHTSDCVFCAAALVVPEAAPLMVNATVVDTIHVVSARLPVFRSQPSVYHPPRIG